MFLVFNLLFISTTHIQQELHRLLFFSLFFVLIISVIRIKIYYRRKETQKFIFNVLDMCLEYNRREHVKHVNNSNDSVEWFYKKLPSENEILYSFKPLKLANFIDQELINKIQS